MGEMELRVQIQQLDSVIKYIEKVCTYDVAKMKESTSNLIVNLRKDGLPSEIVDEIEKNHLNDIYDRTDQLMKWMLERSLPYLEDVKKHLINCSNL